MSSSGVILKGIGGFYYVQIEDRILECRAGGRLRNADLTPVAGDLVDLEIEGEQGYILTIHPRKNLLVRPPIANLDQLCILASTAAPETDPAWIDKQTVIALRRGIKPVILLSKSDLRRSDSLLQTYRSIGFETLEISSATGEGVQQVRELLRGKITAFSGNSGIGKSSLLNSLLPQAGAEVGGLGRKVARGKQTTRAVELYPLPEGGYVADTPGFSTFDILKNDDLRKEDLADWFPEMESALGCCRFTGCAHVKEPGCAVKDLVAQGAVPRTRYDSYCSLYAELSKRKSWE
jgi:ribosome biogenesis GTPase